MTPKDEVLSAYDLAINDVEIERIHKGLINSTWRIKNSHRNFILQKVNHSIFKKPEAIASNVRLIAEYLQQHDPAYLFVSPLKTRDDEEMLKIPGYGYFRLAPLVKN
jgi:hypothetical protein